MNRKRVKFGTVTMLAVVGIGAAACGGSPPPEQPAPAAPPAATPAARPPAASTADADRARREREAEEARRELARKRAVLEEMVFFDFDRSEIREDSKRVLDQKIVILRAEPAIRLLIAGHADDRGSTEYNLALGSRRANAIRDYFTGFGLAESRFEVTTYGEARPLVQGTGEASWSRNRRGEFAIRAGLATTMQ